jgi:sn-glycerol 3-phosphate transport system ATP-binding protein
VFLNYALYPHMSVAQNMGYGLRIRGLPRPEVARRVQEAAALLGIEALLERRPRQLSGGQRQRVAMGRAIVREPKLFLFDEPLSNLDAKLRVQMRAEIRRLQQRLGVTSLFVTHDQVEAMTLGDRLVVMHQGHAAQVATPMEIWAKPADTYVAGFIGSPAMNFLDGTLAEGGAAVALHAGPVIRFADGPRPGPEGLPLTIGIRPEHVVLAADGLTLALELVEPLGSETVLHGSLADGEALVVKLAGMAPPGRTLSVALPPEMLHVFGREDGRRIEPAPRG